jgi:glycerol uptake facilitator-like aquaporin
LLLTYGICISIYLHPIKDKIKDPSSDLFICCFFYFALSVAAPFTGGHMNPAVTLTLNQITKNKNIIAYFSGQFIGAFSATILGNV